MGLRDAVSDVRYTEAVNAKKDVAIEIQAAESSEWVVKEHVTGHAGEVTACVKVTLKITDPSVTTPHADADPKLTFDQTFNLVPHPYLSKKTGGIEYMAPGLLYSLEEALGFDPVYVDAEGNLVPPRITKTGSKANPNQPGVKRKLNPEFANAYFTADDKPNLEWAGLKVNADLKLEESVDGQFPARNVVTRFRKASAA